MKTRTLHTYDAECDKCKGVCKHDVSKPQAVRHTPGTWEVTESGDQIEVQKVDGESIAVVIDGDILANARLIAAAPELLEQLITARELLKDAMLVCDTDREESIKEHLIYINQAIAKAEGRS